LLFGFVINLLNSLINSFFFSFDGLEEIQDKRDELIIGNQKTKVIVNKKSKLNEKKKLNAQ